MYLVDDDSDDYGDNHIADDAGVDPGDAPRRNPPFGCNLIDCILH